MRHTRRRRHTLRTGATDTTQALARETWRLPQSVYALLATVRMTKKREPTRSTTATTKPSAKKRAVRSSESSATGKSERGTAAGLRAGAGSATKAKRITAPGSKLSQKEQTKRGGPGRAGNSSAQRKSSAPRAKTPTRGEELVSAGADAIVDAMNM